MWLGNFTLINLIGLFIQSALIQNILLFYFLGMCSYLACSAKIKTANGLGLAVFVVITGSGVLNWFIREFILKKGALSWLNLGEIDLSFLEFIVYIAVIAAFVQILEMFLDRFSPTLYNALGVYLPLITVNCAILGASLFAATRQYPFIPNLVFVAGAGLGWYLAILLIASIRENLKSATILAPFQGMAITFITTGLIALAFMGFSGISLVNIEDDFIPSSITKRHLENQDSPSASTDPQAHLRHRQTSHRANLNPQDLDESKMDPAQ
jgi:Na+-transporting NADH:ubiquinone oxidoreductase subunit E